MTLDFIENHRQNIFVLTHYSLKMINLTYN